MKKIDEVIMGSSKFPTKTNNGFKDDNSQEPLDKPLSLHMKLKNKTKGRR